MEIFLISVTLCSLLHSTLTETQGMCKGHLPPVKHVAVNGNVSVPCPGLSAQEMRFDLFNGTTTVMSAHVNYRDATIKHNNNLTHLSILNANFTDNSTSFIILNVTMRDTGLYTCMAEVNFPPPWKQLKEMPQTIVVVEESTRQYSSCQHVSLFALWLVLGSIATYGVVMTFVVFVLRVKLSQKDAPCYGFKNMKLKECGRKWQGVQHPTRKGFHIDTVA